MYHPNNSRNRRANHPNQPNQQRVPQVNPHYQNGPRIPIQPPGTPLNGRRVQSNQRRPPGAPLHRGNTNNARRQQPVDDYWLRRRHTRNDSFPELKELEAQGAKETIVYADPRLAHDTRRQRYNNPPQSDRRRPKPPQNQPKVNSSRSKQRNGGPPGARMHKDAYQQFQIPEAQFRQQPQQQFQGQQPQQPFQMQQAQQQRPVFNSAGKNAFRLPQPPQPQNQPNPYKKNNHNQRPQPQFQSQQNPVRYEPPSFNTGMPPPSPLVSKPMNQATNVSREFSRTRRDRGPSSRKEERLPVPAQPQNRQRKKPRGREFDELKVLMSGTYERRLNSKRMEEEQQPPVPPPKVSSRLHRGNNPGNQDLF